MDDYSLGKDWRWRKHGDILFLWDIASKYLRELNGIQPEYTQVNELLSRVSGTKSTLINNLNESSAEESLYKLDRSIIRTWDLINSIEQVPEDVLRLSRDLYSPEETPIELESSIYSNWAFRAKTKKDFRNHKKINPDYWTAINMLFATNQIAYLIGGMEYNKIGMLKEYIDKAEDMGLFIWENMSRFVKYAPKDDDYYLEGSMLNTRNLSKNNEKGVFATIVFKLVNNKWEVFNYSQVHLYDRQWIEYRTTSNFLSGVK